MLSITATTKTCIQRARSEIAPVFGSVVPHRGSAVEKPAAILVQSTAHKQTVSKIPGNTSRRHCRAKQRKHGSPQSNPANARCRHQHRPETHPPQISRVEHRAAALQSLLRHPHASALLFKTAITPSPTQQHNNQPVRDHQTHAVSNTRP